eukprot:6390370-Pyramimonas_sp.AAC.1
MHKAKDVTNEEYAFHYVSVKHCLEMFAEIAEKGDDYTKIYEQFCRRLKQDVPEEPHRTEIEAPKHYHTS